MIPGGKEEEKFSVRFLFLAGAAAAFLRGRVLQTGVFVVWHNVSIRGFIHFVTDDVHQTLENLLYVDVVFGAGLKELETWKQETGKGK